MRSIVAKLKEVHGESGLGGCRLAYDGRSNVYTAKPLPFDVEQHFVVLMEPSRAGREPQNYTIILKHVATRTLGDLQAFFDGRTSQNAYDCITALDVALRHAPSLSYTMVGRNFYSP
ncbi:unnamed protein product, partial [Phaeothamnion confervicola]